MASFPEHSNFIGLLLYCPILYLASRVCNAAADWILMCGCYFVIPTACVHLESEATPVQHNAFQKRFDLCSSVSKRFHSWLWTLSVFSPSPVFCGCYLQPFSWIQFQRVGVVVFFCGWHAWAWSSISRTLMCDCYHDGCLLPWCRPVHRHPQKQQQSQRPKSACILANYFRSQLQGGAADLEQRNMKDCSLSTYCAQAAVPSFFLFSALEGLEKNS